MSDLKNTKNEPAKIRRGSHMHQMTMPVEKAKNFKGTFRRFIDYLKPQGRFRHLTPELVDKIQQRVNKEYAGIKEKAAQ